MGRGKAMYDHRKIERHWQKRWNEERIYQPDLGAARNPFYNLMMFPYPSAEGLHVGNMYAFTGADVYGRFRRMGGKDVFEPIGLDGFGIHSENYAIQIGKHPAEQAKASQKRFYDQLSRIGNGFSWDSRLETYDPAYYRWTQWLFVQMFKRGLAYRKKASVNWCPSCKTVLSDEQVEGGVCERCGTPVERRAMAQWFFKITDFADRLLENIEKIDWPEKIKTAQRNWIGRSAGVEIGWEVEGVGETIRTFTTRLDTIYGVTFLVLAPDHPIVISLLNSEFQVSSSKLKEIQKYVHAALKKTEQKRKAAEKEKTGIDLGIQAVHPLSGETIPIWVADFVMMGYGTGAVMGVPGHDQRDHDFAKEKGFTVVKVIDVGGQEVDAQAVEEYGVLVNSGKFTGLESQEAMESILQVLQKKRLVRRQVSYHLRDWLISRQRYWGPPIPMIFCQHCADNGRSWLTENIAPKHSGSSQSARNVRGDSADLKSLSTEPRNEDWHLGWWPAPEEELPVLLPEMRHENVKPTGDGRSPLEKAPETWLYTECPGCGKRAKRETDVSDTFLDSSWYFLAYPNLQTREWRGSKAPFNKALTKKWLPVSAYIGGAEHAVLHLLYARFVTMALYDWGYLSFEEPFPYLFSHGLLIKDGAKMSKSRGNVVIPDEYLKKYGSDTLRTYLMFLGPYDQGGDFRDTGIAGMYRFLSRIWRLYQVTTKKDQVTGGKASSLEKVGRETDKELVGPLHRTIKKVTEDIASFRFNTAIASLMEFVNDWERGKALSLSDATIFLKLLSPFSPHITEELWQNIQAGGRSKERNSIHVSSWPKYQPQLVAFKEAEIVVQVNGKLRGRLRLPVEEAGDRKGVVRLAKELPRVRRYLKKASIGKTIWVEGKLVNFVLS